MNTIFQRILLLASLLAISLGITSSLADDFKPLLTVRIVQIIPEKYHEFVELQKQMAEADREAGAPARHVWQELRGESNTYHIVTEGENFAEFGEPSENSLDDYDRATWFNRIIETVSSRKVVTIRGYQSLRIENDPNREPKFIVLSAMNIRYGKNSAYREWLEHKAYPALRAIGSADRSTYKTVHGGNMNRWITAQHFDTWADLDGPGPFAAIEKAERDALFAELNDVLESRETKVLRYRADLSNKGPQE